MKLRLIALSFAVTLAVHGVAHAHDTDSQAGPLGKVTFATSCDSKVQPSFERAVAMLHSFWFSAGEKAFRDVLAEDPKCAIAAWGVAEILMNNPMAGQGASPKGAEQAQSHAEEDQRHSLLNKQSHHICALSSERQTDANLVRALSDEVRDYPVNADPGEQ